MAFFQALSGWVGIVNGLAAERQYWGTMTGQVAAHLAFLWPDAAGAVGAQGHGPSPPRHARDGVHRRASSKAAPEMEERAASSADGRTVVAPAPGTDSGYRDNAAKSGEPRKCGC